MTKKVFRIHDQGALTDDWFSSTPINEALIDSINTSGGDGKKLPTSIPSPFARIDLVRTAFSNVGNSGQLDGNVINGVARNSDNHKLISDALDIGQIFFNYDKHKKDLQLVAWDKQTSLNILLNGNDKQKHLGKTLDLFLRQDSTQYNFDNFDKIYILKYKYKIIGGTSPRTLFFAAPSVSVTDIKFGEDTMLDNELHPLYKRDKEYVKYLFALSKKPNFNSFFPEVNSYLNKNFEKIKQIDASFYNELMTLNTNQHLGTLSNVVFNGNAGQPLDVINGFSLRQYIVPPSEIEKNSDFVIVASKQIDGLKPLVLPVDPLILRYKYTLDSWNSETKVPVEDLRPLNERRLPEQEDIYPYLTMNDFLSNTIIKLPYDIDKDRFFTVGANKFLLPLTKLFFDYFSVEDIKHKDVIEMRELSGNGIEVKLKIPIKKGAIEYTKTYYASTNSNNPAKGIIIEKSFAFSIYPFVYSDQTSITYSLGLADVSPKKGSNLNIEVTNTVGSNLNIETRHKQRSKSPHITSQTIVQNRFDAITIKYEGAENYLIPSWPIYNGRGGDNYEFAIDFGTTNSHIEYKIEGQGSEKAFDISETDSQIVFLMPKNTSRRSEAITNILDGESHLKQEVISKNFGKNELRNSPFRTCLVQNKDVNYNESTSVFADVNAGFDYEKVPIRPYLKSFTDLKWAKDNTDNTRRLSHYIEELLLLCKNKVLINDGNLVNTKITWFYPVSMSSSHLNKLRKVWRNNFTAIFGDNVPVYNLIDFPESVAPFYYYREREGIPTMARPSVSIDIGGGTTDLMIYADGEPKLISSFKFAGNAIFGDGFNGNVRTNGFVKKYFTEFKEILEQNKLTVELEILQKLYDENQTSQDLINFFFSLHKNKNIENKQLKNLNFSEKLSEDSDLKIILLLFYSAIIYHIAELMKIKGLDTPRNIVFSGTGSKTLQILDGNTNNYPFLKELFEAIFNNVYHEKDSVITLKSSENPKEVTCKGGFYLGDNLNDLNHIEMVEVNIGNSQKKAVQSISKISQDTIRYKDLTRPYLEGIVDNIENFYELFDKLMIELNFRDKFDISIESIRVYNDVKSRDLLDYVMHGVENLKSDTVDEDPLGETLFFYPLIGKLNELANEITNDKF